MSQVDSSNSSLTKKEFPPLSDFVNHKFEIPSKRIANPQHIQKFLQSSSYKLLTQFLQKLNKSVKSIGMDFNSNNVSNTVKKVLLLLAEIHKLVNETDKLPHNISISRYGNKAFRILIQKIHQNSDKLIRNILPESWLSSKNENENKTLVSMINEIKVYLLSSFGDKTRIDYGTGHELNFFCFLFILKRLNLFNSKNDNVNIVNKIFNSYLILMRKIQTKYLLEPAGSRGVWGLDDYQFLSFYFGASQLIDNKLNILPKDILNNKFLNDFNICNKFMYLQCIKFILKMKKGNFYEHSPLLNDISGVPIWDKVNSGLYKMYQDDVFKKFPVIQHFLFGSILTINLPKINSTQSNEKAERLKRQQALIDRINKQNQQKKLQKLKQMQQQSKNNTNNKS